MFLFVLSLGEEVILGSVCLETVLGSLFEFFQLELPALFVYVSLCVRDSEFVTHETPDLSINHPFVSYHYFIKDDLWHLGFHLVNFLLGDPLQNFALGILVELLVSG